MAQPAKAAKAPTPIPGPTTNKRDLDRARKLTDSDYQHGDWSGHRVAAYNIDVPGAQTYYVVDKLGDDGETVVLGLGSYPTQRAVDVAIAAHRSS